ncbi:whey acidic protein-like [Homarus americanus]|uniref:Putative crustin-like antimicrobial peptide 14 n=1 Tax=Homarus americanus TaxID=6706 RepID=A0A8J5MRK3_HOMAM|nr:whey acidic protein-like [Homarus americanus]KAG7161393.1 putative crustin-like antimicrobial peptide 14 [Homarus americanus]
MSLRVLVLVACVAVALAHTLPPPPPPSSDCTAFCVNPDPFPGAPDYICCDPHLGRCPLKRLICPFADVLVPSECSKDYECEINEKCCEDACLSGKVCKAAQF